MNSVKEIQKLNEEELRLGLLDSKSWHAQYKGSAWVYIGGLTPELTEGDVLCVFSQWGEIEDLHLIRDEGTGRGKGFAFLKYEDWRSTVLAVDNMTGSTLCGRTLRVDHKLGYEPPKVKGEVAAEKEALAAGIVLPLKNAGAGHAYEGRKIWGEASLERGMNVFAPSPQRSQQQLPQVSAHTASLQVAPPPPISSLKQGSGHVERLRARSNRSHSPAHERNQQQLHLQRSRSPSKERRRHERRHRERERERRHHRSRSTSRERGHRERSRSRNHDRGRRSGSRHRGRE